MVRSQIIYMLMYANVVYFMKTREINVIRGNNNNIHFYHIKYDKRRNHIITSIIRLFIV